VFNHGLSKSKMLGDEIIIGLGGFSSVCFSTQGQLK
jgi:hypothetical protein